MTLYFWQLQKQDPLQSILTQNFHEGARDRDNGFCVYVNDEGKALKVGFVTSDQNPTIKNATLIGSAENGQCIVTVDGKVSMCEATALFCMRNNIEPTFNDIMSKIINPDKPAFFNLKSDIKYKN